LAIYISVITQWSYGIADGSSAERSHRGVRETPIGVPRPVSFNMTLVNDLAK
jgi:hypothetical protein